MPRSPKLTEPRMNPVSWKKDRSLRTALVVALIVRVVPLLAWINDTCLRDECTYLKLGKRFAEGEGMTSSSGWIWAPGYPFLLGLFETLTGIGGLVKIIQLPAALLSCVLVYELTRRAFPGNQKAAQLSAWMYALSPHMAFFAIRLWSEVLYGTILLGGLLLLLNSRDETDSEQASKGYKHTALVGFIGGICVLFRGVATYMLPIWLFSVLWNRWRNRRAWAQVVLLSAAAVLTVAPYSLHASEKFGGPMISDRTMGQMMWLGNNDFDPITFDYGNGQLSRRAFLRTSKQGRPEKECGSKKDAYERDVCQTEAGVAWIKDHPDTFVRRMPMRVAQLLNPHSLLTRHLRWGKFPGMPQWVDEFIILAGCAHSLVTLLVGAFAMTTRGRGAQAILFAGILSYHCAAIAVLAGLSRYRVPLEPLLMVYAAGVLTDPRAAWSALGEGPLRWRLWLTLGVMSIVTPLVLWYLPAGWPWWRSW